MFNLTVDLSVFNLLSVDISLFIFVGLLVDATLLLLLTAHTNFSNDWHKH